MLTSSTVMDLKKSRRQAPLSWLLVGALVILSITLGVLQYTWIGEVSRAEGDRLRGSLQASLHRLSQDFNAEINTACSALLPDITRWDQAEREKAYAIRYAQWRRSSAHNGLFRRLALVLPQGDTLILRDLDLDKGTFGPAEWPAAWNTLRDRLTARLSDDPVRRRESFGGLIPQELPLIDLPQFGRPEGHEFG